MAIPQMKASMQVHHSSITPPPDPEVAATAKRRQFSASEKRRILAAADRCNKTGEIGALLRREGIYSSQLTTWRKLHRAAEHAALASQKRGRKADPAIAEARRVAEHLSTCNHCDSSRVVGPVVKRYTQQGLKPLNHELAPYDASTAPGTGSNPSVIIRTSQTTQREADTPNAVLVTGGAGYIGSHTCKALARAGYLPVSYDNLVHGHRWAVQWGPLVEGDLADAELLKETFDRYRISAVLHFAGYCYVGESMSAPEKYFRNNAANTLTLLEAMLAAEVNAIVFSSTCATYGMPAQVPMNEESAQCPINPYGESKLFVEKMLRWWGSAHGLRWMALRYFNAAGADLDGQIGEEHSPETHLIPLTIQAALGHKEGIDVFGVNYPTRDGTAIRDYVHVTDLADAHVRALERLQHGAASRALNLGTGTGRSVREVIGLVQEVSGRTFTVREMPRRAGDPAELVADARQAFDTLQWQPRYSDLRTIVETAWYWHSHHHAQVASETLVRSAP